MVSASEKSALPGQTASFQAGVKMSPFSLRFLDQERENEFWQVDRDNGRAQYILVLYLAPILYSLFGILDATLFPDHTQTLWTIRFGAVIPVLLALIVCLHLGAFKRWAHPILAIGGLYSGLGIVLMTAILPAEKGGPYYAGVILVLVFIHHFLRLPFLQIALISGLIIVAWEVVAIWINPLPLWELVNNNFFLISVQFVGLFAAYMYERSRRKNFLHLLVIDQDRAELKTLNQELETIAVTDPLTGLYNRRVLRERLAEKLSLFRRYDHPASLLMVDLDAFKAVNDTHGHGVGDDLLVEVATALKDGVRDTDMVFRVGGDEFCVAFANTPLADAKGTAERILKKLDELPMRGVSPERRVGFSGGIAEAQKEHDDPEAWLKAADRLLYAAKNAGKGRIFSSLDEG
jgi:diguanylate cyclase (GGDEF)-like protein